MFDWTRRTKGVFDQLIKILSATIKELESFMSSDGDICYFFNFDDSQAPSQDHARQLLRRIKEKFERLRVLHQMLTHLQHSCRNLTEDVGANYFILFAVAFQEVSLLTGLVETSHISASQRIGTASKRVS